MKNLSVRLLLAVLSAIILLGGCGQQQQRAAAANREVPVPSSEGDQFQERRQIIDRDLLSNRTDLVVYAYWLSDTGALIDQWTCRGLPASSTESVEPNQIFATSAMGYGVIADVDEERMDV